LEDSKNKRLPIVAGSEELFGFRPHAMVDQRPPPLSLYDRSLSRREIDICILSRTSSREPLNGPVDSILMDVSAAANLSESSTE
jgi:hypothetical protein